MKCQVNTLDIKKAIRIVAHAVATRGPEMLQTVLMTAGEDCLRLQATNLDLCVDWRLPATVQEPGAACVFFAKFKAIVNGVSCAELELESDIKALFAKTRNGQQSMWLNNIDLPLSQPSGDEQWISVPAEWFADSLRWASHAVKITTLGPMSCVQVSACGGQLSIAGTDEHRLAFSQLDGVEGEWSAVTPLGGARLMTALIEGSKAETCLVALSGKELRIRHGDNAASVFLMQDVRFPNWRAFISIHEQHEQRCVVNRRELQEAALDARRVAADVAEKPIRLALADGQLTISARSDSGIFCANLSLAAGGKGSFRLAVNGELFSETIYGLKGEAAMVAADGELAPFSIQSNGKVAVFMPLEMPKEDHA